jgi:hypothetical protein
MTIHNFSAEVVHPVTQEQIDCEVKYRMIDMGIGMWPTLFSVTTEQGEDILPKLDDETISNIECEAALRYAEEG